MKARQLRQLRQELEASISGGVAFDATHRAVYSTDASIYRQAPLGVVFPRNPEEARLAVRIATANDVAVLPRGGGTSLAGQTTTRGIVLDLSRHLRQIIAIDPQSTQARVQAGVVLDQLNARAADDGLIFGPDVATSSRACIGGMIGNNSCGARSVVYGKTVDHIVALKLILADGRELELGPELPAPSLLSGRDPAAEILARALGLAQEVAPLIEERFPKLLRRVSGYNLDRLLEQRPNPAHLIAGSEGTLGLITEATLKLAPRPAHRVLGLIYWDDLGRAMDAVPRILETHPSAVELVDRLLIDLTRRSAEFAPKAGVFRGHPEAVLVVEYSGEDLDALRGKLDELSRVIDACREAGRVDRIVDPAAQADVWAVRKAGLGILMSLPGSAKPIAFVEDASVPPEHLGAFVRRFRTLIRREGAKAAFYGHASAGCLHIRPILDLKHRRDRESMTRIAREVMELVQEFGGSLSGEHGDGRARSHLLEDFFGAELTESFARLKAYFDPAGHFNPGVIVNPEPMTSSLRADPPSQRGLEPEAWFLSHQGGGLLKASERCNGNGACRKLSSGVMCPSYMATHDELHSTRGRANALRAALAGEIEHFDPLDPGLYAAMELCVGCKGCQRECPTTVDMAKMKVELLALRHAELGVGLRDRFFGRWPELARLASPFAGLTNQLTAWAPARNLANRVLGLDPTRSLPPLAPQTFRRWFETRGRKAQPERPRVLLLDDTFTHFHEPALGQDAVQVLEAAGYEVCLPPRRICCGRTYISRGLLEDAQRRAREALATLEPFVEAGTPMVGLEPSCLLTFRDEIPDLVDSPTAKALASRCFTLAEFLDSLPEAPPFRAPEGPVTVHGHCHQKSLVGMGPTARVLQRIPGLQFDILDTSCCGMAGSFGYEAEHAEMSHAMAKASLLPALQAHERDGLLLMDGFSCRHQIDHLSGRRAIHLASFLAEALDRDQES